MEILDAFAAKYRRVLTAVKVLDALFVFLTHIRSEVTLIGLIILVHVRVSLEALLEIDAREQWVSRHDLIEDVKVEGELVH